MKPPIYTRNSREAGRRRRRGTLLICAAGVLAAWGWMVVLGWILR